MADQDPDKPDRRRFLKIATCAIGGGVGAVIVVPALRLLADPAGKITVTSPTAPIDLGADRLQLGAPPTRLDVVAPVVRDGWTAQQDVVLGAAWVRRTAVDKVEALSAICPHLGCAVGWDAAANNFLCPCHDSRFAATGDKLTGPSERGLDPLPIAVKDGRLQLTWMRFRGGVPTREPA